jgi:hypothetical protein
MQTYLCAACRLPYISKIRDSLYMRLAAISVPLECNLQISHALAVITTPGHRCFEGTLREQF